MALGINSDFDIASTTECADCQLDDQCFTNSCEARLWIAKCGSIDYTTGELKPDCQFIEPSNYKIDSFDPNYTILEKDYQGCKPRRYPAQPDPSFTLTWDICQSDPANIWLLGRCWFDYILTPKGNNLNFEENPSIWDQRTKTWWGRTIGDNYSWEFPARECQNTSRTFMTDAHCYETGIEASIPTAEGFTDYNRLLQTAA